MLTLSQSIALEALKDFLDRPIPNNQVNDIICLSGSPGTGKSYLISELAKDMPDDYIVKTAVTNKASNNIRGKTLCKLLGVTLQEDYHSGKTTYLSRGDASPIKIYGLNIVIDEASMIEEELWGIVQDKCKQCKIILIGDKYQLPAVKNPANLFDRYPVLELSEVVRQKDQSLIDVIEATKAGVIAGKVPTTLPPSDKVEYLYTPEVCTEVLSNFYEGLDVALAFTNNTVKALSFHMRQCIGKPYEPVIGDYMILRNYLEVNGCYFSPETEFSVSEIWGKRTVHVTDDITIKCHELRITTEKYNTENTFIVWVPVSSTKFDLVLKHLAQNKRWREYFIAKKKFADLRFCNCSTVHCSQGDTYRNVFIHAEDILGVASNRQGSAFKARLFYVALSRAKEKVYIYDPKRYFKN